MSMELTGLMDSLLSVQTPALPGLAVLRSARYLSWALVLASLIMLLGQHWPKWLQRGLAVLLLLWTLTPGPVSPAFWLGLAFQMPSLMSTAIAALVLVFLWRDQADSLRAWVTDSSAQRAGEAGVLLGWLLLLDTFAVLPACVLLAVLPWMIWATHPGARRISLLLVAVLAVHVLLRLPTGNVWDALLDPWLWLLLQLSWLVRVVRYFMARWRASKATRA
jgi:hypothetical protein